MTNCPYLLSSEKTYLVEIVTHTQKLELMKSTKSWERRIYI